jgi:hypothetical protein
MSRDENAPRTGRQPEYNPYAPPQAPLGIERGRLMPAPPASRNVAGTMSVTHKLTDDDLRCFVSCDALYDAMPLFGLIPQWKWLMPITASIGFSFSLLQTRSWSAALVSAPAMCMIVLAIMVLLANSRRVSARLAGLCENRTLTISPDGLTLTIPEIHAVPKDLATVGPLAHRWSDVRKIEVRKGHLLFWLKGRLRLVLPLRAFPSPADADAFVQAATRWHTDAA